MEIFFDLTSHYFLITLFFAGLSTGFIGAMGGSGGLILVPFMIAVGMSPALALGTARFAAMPAWVLAIKNFNASGNVDWRRVGILSALAVIAGSLGTFIIIDIPQHLIYPIVGTILILIAPLALLKKGYGLTRIKKSQTSLIIGHTLYFIAMIYGGFFGAGTTSLTMFILITFMGYKSLEAHGTEMAAWIAMSVISSLIFLYHGHVNFTYAAVICISMMIGSHFGSKLAIKNGDKFVKWLVCGFAFVIGVRLLFFTA